MKLTLLASRPDLARLGITLSYALLLLAGPAFAQDAPSSSTTEEWIYTVQPGDTLSQIASQHLANAVAWKQLQKLNKIADPNKLTPGSSLRVPYGLSSPDLAHAEALRVKGTVTVSRGKGTPVEPLETGAKLRVGTTIETGEDGMLTLRFADQSRMLVSPNGRLTLTHLQFKRSTGEGLMRATLENGSVESQVTQQKAVKARYEIKTPSLNLAVRGTTFRVQLDGKTGLTRSSVLEGEVKAGNAKGEVSIPAGFGTTANLGSSPSKPRALLPPPQLASATATIHYFPSRFDWQPLSNALQYRVEITELEGGEERLVQTLTTLDSHSAWTALPNSDYRVRVRGIDDVGMEGRNAAYDFKVQAWPPAPMVHAPLDADIVAGEKINFRWARVMDADYMRFQVARDPEFKDIAMQVKSLTARSGGMAVPLKPGRYFWRIAAGKKQTGMGPFGPVQTFEVADLPKGESPNLLRWQPAEAGERYKVQIATHYSFADLLVDTEGAVSEVRLPDVAKTLYVRMKRIATNGFPGDFEPVQAFEPSR